MSKVAIQGNASGTGTFTIASPNSNTDRTLTLPDEAGTVLTSASTLSSSNLSGALPALDGSALTSVVYQPDVAYFYLTAADQSLSTASWTKIQFNGTVVDTQSAWDGTNYRYQPTVAGYYSVIVSATLRGTGGADRFVSIWKNNSSVGYFHLKGATTGEIRIDISRLVYLNGSSHYIEGFCYSDGTSGIEIGGNDQGQDSGMWIHLVRPD